jgi:hypothetical protein
MASSRSRCRRRSAHSSPRRAPVVIASQTREAHAWSFHASSSKGAASFAEGRRRLRCRRWRRLRAAGRAHGDPAPANRAFHGPQRIQRIWRTVDAARGPTDFGLAAFVALVRCLRPVVHSPTAPVVVHTTAPQLRVERVENLAIELAQWQGAQHRAHVDVEVADVRLARRLLELDHREVPIEQLVDRCLRPGVPLLVDLVEQARPDLLGLGSALGPPQRSRSGHDACPSVGPAPRTHAPSAFCCAADRPFHGSGRPAWTRTGRLFRVTRSDHASRRRAFSQLRRGAGGARTHDRRIMRMPD